MELKAKGHEMKTELYFAYGSNTHPLQIKRRCPRATPIGVATLSGFRLGWVRRRGGESRTTIVEDSTAETRGVIYAGVDLDSMDRFEGEGYTYKRRQAHVETSEGSTPVHTYPVHTYEAITGQTCAHPDRLSAEYATTVGHGRARHGLETPGVCLVAVYGSLRKGFENHRILAEPADFARFVGCTHVNGLRLVDLGSFPGAYRSQDEYAVCELYAVGPKTLDQLDRLEGHPKMYRRELAHTFSGTLVQTYIYQSRAAKNPTIPGGDWAAYKNRNQNEFLF